MIEGIQGMPLKETQKKFEICETKQHSFHLLVKISVAFALWDKVI